VEGQNLYPVLKGMFRDDADAICVLLNGRLVMVNYACARVFGYKAPELMEGLGLAEIIAPEECERVRGFTLRRSRGEAAPQEYLTTGRRLDGSSFGLGVHATAYPFNGQFAVLAVLRDLAQIDQNTERQAEDYARFRGLFDLLPDPFWILDDDRFVECNAAAVAMLGYASKEALLFAHPSDLSPKHQPDGSESYEKARRMIHLAREKGIHRFEWEHMRADGSQFPAEVTISASTYHGRQVLLAIWRDITERKQAETELRVAATALESVEGLIISDAKGVILQVNQAFAEITGYAPEDAVGQRTNLLRSGRHGDAFYAEMWESINSRGLWKGEIWNRRKNGEIYPEWLSISAVKGPTGSVSHYVGTFTDITQHKKSESQIRELAYFDPLTRLPNRRLFFDRLGHALAASIRNNRDGGLMFIDLDNFKVLNDTLGHAAGDELLEQVAGRLTACVRDVDTIARFGGDEFVVMVEDLSETPGEAAAQVEVVGRKILAALNQPFVLASQVWHAPASIGATLFGEHQWSIDELMKQADIAMYQAKAAGRNTLCFFDPELQKAIRARASLEADLHSGIESGQIILHYQPQVNGRGQLTGAEALVRWHHPERGLVSPAEFIPLAEETGLILAIGNCVLETGCSQIVAWTKREETAHLTLAVNVSVRQFRQVDFVEQVLSVINRTGVNPRRLKLELTESMLVDDVAGTIAKMMALKSCGISFSLDDFGTGYSSLAYLKRLPLDQLKIDQSFVRDVLNDSNDAVIAKAIVSLAQSLGLEVIAEGVETAEQREFLAESGCHAYQGYFFSRPLSLQAFEDFVRQN